VRSRDREIRYAVMIEIDVEQICSAVSDYHVGQAYIIFASHGGVKRSKLTPAAPAASVYMLSR
jgi:hypothetical protein